jgi:fatty acid desaturase
MNRRRELDPESPAVPGADSPDDVGKPAFRAGHRYNRLLVACAVLLSVCQLYLLPLWLLPMNPAWAWVTVPIVLCTTPFWSLVHEAIHGSLFPSRAWNDRCGRVLSVLFGAPFSMLKIGHLLHHRYSRTERDRTEVFDPTTTNRGNATIGYFVWLLGGLYVSEFFAFVLAALPTSGLRRLATRLDAPDTVAGLLFERLSRQPALTRFRIDSAAQMVVFTTAVLAYSRWWWVLVLGLLGRALLVALADNSYHYGTPSNDPLGAMNLRLPRVLERFVLNFNLHDVHHRHPGVEWFDLPDRFRENRAEYDIGWFTAIFRQLRGPISAADAPRTRADADL